MAGLTDARLDFAAVQELLGPAFAKINQFARLLELEGPKRGLIGPGEIDRLWTRHLLNSCALEPFLPKQGLVIDIGSGAGLPGVVLALLRPNQPFELVDAMQRRTKWLAQVVASLGIENVTVTWSRAEALASQRKAQAVVSRAVASLPKLIDWSWPLLAQGGSFLALKGRAVHLEIAALQDCAGAFELGQLTLSEVVPLNGMEPTYVVHGRMAGVNVSGVHHNCGGTRSGL